MYVTFARRTIRNLMRRDTGEDEVQELTQIRGRTEFSQKRLLNTQNHERELDPLVRLYHLLLIHGLRAWATQHLEINTKLIGDTFEILTILFQAEPCILAYDIHSQ